MEDRAKKSAQEWVEANQRRLVEETRFQSEALEQAYLAGYAAGSVAATRRETPDEVPQ